ncbi:MAG: MFS transporter [Actinomycetota bacterium]|nr:MFS transporter [Actinomycetota bacterium]
MFGTFGFFGLFWGTFAVLLADLSWALVLSPGPLGLALFAGAAASIAAMAAFGWTADRFGRRVFLMISAGVFGLGIAGLAVADSYAALILVLIVLYAASGLYDVGINAAAVDLEKSTGRRYMALLHATFSAGGVAGALSAGALLQFGVGFRHVYLMVLIPLFALILAVTTIRFPAPASSEQETDAGRYDLFGSLPLLFVAAIATLGLLSEGEMEHWSGIYLRDTVGLPALLGGSGVAVFFAAMAVGRLGASLIISRFGNRRTLLGAGMLAVGGMTLALSTMKPAVIITGFLLVGLALSAVVPVAFSMAGDVAPGRAGSAISVVTTFGYGGFLLGPVIVGGLAELFGLRIALGTIAIAGLMIFLLSLRLDRQRKEQRT